MSMETSMDKIKNLHGWLKKNELIFISIRILATYLICLMIVQHTYIYTRGLSPTDGFAIIVISLLVTYKILLYAIVPGLMSYWLFQKLLQEER